MATLRQHFEHRMMRGALGLPVRLRSWMFGTGPDRVRGESLHPDFATMLGLQKLLRIPQLDEIADGKGLAAARAEYSHLCGMTAMHRMQAEVAVEAGELPGADGPLRALLLRPSTAGEDTPLLVYFHGGGFMLGSPDAYVSYLRFVAAQTGVCIAAVQYRLAPEHPFPTPVQDATAALLGALRGEGSEGPSTGWVLVGGDSAGAVLAIEATHAAVQQGHAPAGVWLFNPGVHVRGKYPSDRDFGEGCGFTEAMRDWFESAYMPDLERTDDPLVSPLFLGDLDGFPPTYLGVGGCDPLRDQIEKFAARLSDAGVALTFRLEPGFIHNYPIFLGLSASVRAATEQACRWLSGTAHGHHAA